MDLLREGNLRRKTEPTEANATSSRSHAVPARSTSRKDRARGYKSETLPGSSRSWTWRARARAGDAQRGHKFRDGAPSTALPRRAANCINALGKKNAGQGVYVPFRNSKLTRLLKDGLSGNSRTAMVANVSCGGDQYAHTINTLKYADRAKEIKTHVVQNLQTVESHIGEYQRLIDTLQGKSRASAKLREQDRNRSGSGPSSRTTTHPTTREGPGGNPGSSTRKEGLGDDGKGGARPRPSRRKSLRREEGDEQTGAPSGRSRRRAFVRAGGLPSRWLEELCEELRENGEARVDTQRALFERRGQQDQNKCEAPGAGRAPRLGAAPGSQPVGRGREGGGRAPRAPSR